MNQNKKEILLSFLGAALFWIPVILIIAYSGYRNNIEYCDKINNDTIPRICKLRYPILDLEEIKKLKRENEKLKNEVSELQYKLDDIKDTINDEKDPDNWQPDPIQRDY